MAGRTVFTSWKVGFSYTGSGMADQASPVSDMPVYRPQSASFGLAGSKLGIFTMRKRR